MRDQIMLFYRVRSDTHADYARADYLASTLCGDLGMGRQHQDFLKVSIPHSVPTSPRLPSSR